MATQSVASHGLRTFLVVWFGQLLSLVGSGLTGFALGVWIFESTGSVTQFALILLFTTLPGIAISPLAGALVDRWDRRTAMMVSDIGAGLCTLTMALLLMAGHLDVWHIYVATAISSAFSAFQWPAYSAATTLLVPKEHLGRASGLSQGGEAAAQIISPLVAGILMGVIGVEGVMLIDVATLAFALVTLVLIRIPKPPQSAEAEEARGSLLHEAAFGWTYIRARRGLLALLLFFATVNFAGSLIQVIFTPLVLSFTTPEVLGLIMTIGGFGFLAGSLAMSVWGGPKRRITGILWSSVLAGLVLFAAAFPPRAEILGAAAFVYFACLPITNGCSQAIWQVKTEPDVQGRVFATRRMIAWASLPLAYATGGPLADLVFEPLMAVDGKLSGTIGRVMGTGPGRGIALLAALLGAVTLVAVVGAYAYPHLRRMEAELPDVVTDEPEAAFASV